MNRQPYSFSRLLHLLLASLFFLVSNSAFATTNKHKGDDHYTEAGFFDIHVCHWPKRPLFFLSLFSTTQFDDIKKIEIYDNNNKFLDELNLTKYRMIMLDKPKREKRVFIKQIDIPESSGSGWYSTRVHMKNGKIITGKDYVIMHSMDIATSTQPQEGSSLAKAPKKFTWDPVPGAAHYQIFINDAWEGKNILSSKLLDKPEFTPPKNLFKKGGAYCWRVHARDVNENILLGDFNHGSLTKCMEFDISE